MKTKNLHRRNHVARSGGIHLARAVLGQLGDKARERRVVREQRSQEIRDAALEDVAIQRGQRGQARQQVPLLSSAVVIGAEQVVLLPDSIAGRRRSRLRVLLARHPRLGTRPGIVDVYTSRCCCCCCCCCCCWILPHRRRVLPGVAGVPDRLGRVRLVVAGVRRNAAGLVQSLVTRSGRGRGGPLVRHDLAKDGPIIRRWVIRQMSYTRRDALQRGRAGDPAAMVRTTTGGGGRGRRGASWERWARHGGGGEPKTLRVELLGIEKRSGGVGFGLARIGLAGGGRGEGGTVACGETWDNEGGHQTRSGRSGIR